MKLIFLGIDRVLNSWSDRLNDHFLPECMARLNKIVFATGAKVVLSSSWRNLIHEEHLSVYGFALLLRTHGFRGEVIGYTRQEKDDEPDPRWSQIADYLKLITGLESYCIIDDDQLAFGGRPGVMTDGNGLSDSDVALAISILGLKTPIQAHGLIQDVTDIGPDTEAA